MKLAILFWFYKEPEICENRLKLLKKNNPELKIFGLYGGDQNKASLYKSKLGKYLDDFYVSPYKRPSWKWIHGDLVILDWYKNRAKSLPWDSVVVVQWDMLVFDYLARLFKGIKKGEIFLSGLRTLTKEIEGRWYWTKPGGEERKNYLSFIKYIKQNYAYQSKLPCCLFILQVFPRSFFEKYLTVKKKTIGMLEYKVPSYAKIFKTPFFKKDFGVSWFSGLKQHPLNAKGDDISPGFINSELKKKSGWRIFHPYYKLW